MTGAERDRLADALAAEHAAVWGYGEVGGRLAGGALNQARAAEAAHRDRRDALLLRLSGDGGPVPAAQLEYQLPFPVTDQIDALKLAVYIETRTGAVWRAAVPAATGAGRRVPLDALTDCALRAARWRRLSGQVPGTEALPGTSTGG